MDIDVRISQFSDILWQVTLEDLMFDIKDLSKSQFEMITHCATRMGLRVISKVKVNSKDHLSLLRRSLKARDISKILQLNDGKSGRYEIVSRLLAFILLWDCE